MGGCGARHRCYKGIPSKLTKSTERPSPKPLVKLGIFGSSNRNTMVLLGSRGKAQVCTRSSNLRTLPKLAWNLKRSPLRSTVFNNRASQVRC